MLSANIQTLSPESPVELFEISNYRISNPEETFRFCNYSNVSYRLTPNSTPHPYIGIPVQASGFELVGQGAIPQPKLTIANVGGVLSSLLFSMKSDPDYRLEGSSVTRRVTQKNYLEDGEDKFSAIRELPFHLFVIEQINQETYKAVEITLSSPFDFEGVTLPGRICLRTCGFQLRGEGCEYAGSLMFDRRNNPVSNIREDICAKTLSACELRFGVGNLLRFGGFPGLGRKS